MHGWREDQIKVRGQILDGGDEALLEAIQAESGVVGLWRVVGGYPTPVDASAAFSFRPADELPVEDRAETIGLEA
jgi:hypothetical protein